MRYLLDVLVTGFLLALNPEATDAPIKQVPLLEAQVLAFIRVHDELGSLALPIITDQSSENVARKHGFGNLAEYIDVAANISLIATRIDPHVRNFVEVQILVAKQIDEVLANKSLANIEKRKMLDHLHKELNKITPIKYRANIALVLRHFGQIKRCCDNDLVQRTFATTRAAAKPFEQTR